MKSVGVLLIYTWCAAFGAAGSSSSSSTITGSALVTSRFPGSASTTLSPPSTTPSSSGNVTITSTASVNTVTTATSTTAAATTPSTTPSVFVCPKTYCRDTQFNPPSTTTCIYPDPIVLMDCWEKYCDKIQVGSYCLVWEPPSGRMCHGTNKPCYCSDYEAVQGRYVSPSSVPVGWEVATECNYNGSPDDYPDQRPGDNTQPTPPAVSGASGLVVTGAAVAAGALLLAEVL
ncbi:hypothetical protein FOZ62_019646 [Perkinsus olseni]|uniref:Uncharacterized protein n=1 Tax=Perkinsus olseni TaxID=32597 RepID=A0A7J6T7B0_PEROL|nr:hypothetical protein FOZ62_019646 [Perkinsus olseni]